MHHYRQQQQQISSSRSIQAFLFLDEHQQRNEAQLKLLFSSRRKVWHIHQCVLLIVTVTKKNKKREKNNCKYVMEKKRFLKVYKQNQVLYTPVRTRRISPRLNSRFCSFAMSLSCWTVIPYRVKGE